MRGSYLAPFLESAKNRYVGVENLIPFYTERCKNCLLLWKVVLATTCLPPKRDTGWDPCVKCKSQHAAVSENIFVFALERRGVCFIREKRGKSRSLFAWASPNVFVDIPYNNIVILTLRLKLLYKHWE